jgi:predicted ribosome-associated RNA-binding protein Tma20
VYVSKQLRQRIQMQEREAQDLRNKLFRQEETIFDMSATMATYEVECKSQAELTYKNVASELNFKVNHFSTPMLHCLC